MHPYNRMSRVSELVKEVVAEIILKDISSADTSLITVTDVKVAADLRTAKVYISFMGESDKRGDILALLQSSEYLVKDLMSKRIRLKYTPALRFIYDDTVDRAGRIDELLDRIKDDREE